MQTYTCGMYAVYMPNICSVVVIYVWRVCCNMPNVCSMVEICVRHACKLHISCACTSVAHLGQVPIILYTAYMQNIYVQHVCCIYA